MAYLIIKNDTDDKTLAHAVTKILFMAALILTLRIIQPPDEDLTYLCVLVWLGYI
jgi:hypothetical protein